MKPQYASSTKHHQHIDAGLSVSHHHEHGEGDAAVSLVRYSDGSTWIFTNASAEPLVWVYGYASANASSEPAWFLTDERAQEFNRDCGGTLGEPSYCFADAVSVSDILP